MKHVTKLSKLIEEHKFPITIAIGGCILEGLTCYKGDRDGFLVGGGIIMGAILPEVFNGIYHKGNTKTNRDYKNEN